MGTGQFGAVRLVRSKVTNEVFALKVRGSLVLRFMDENIYNIACLLEPSSQPCLPPSPPGHAQGPHR